jgi:hypothetical protein
MGMSDGSIPLFSLQGLHRDPFDRLVLPLSTEEAHVGIIPVRAFPLSAPDEWIVLCDQAGHEICSIQDLKVLPESVQRLLREELSRREFLPVIQRIDHISPGAEPTLWHVATDRGETSFTLLSEDDFRTLEPHGVLLVDASGIRYRVMDQRHLDAHSRRLLKRYL